MLRVTELFGFGAGNAVAEVRTGAQALLAGEDGFAIDATTLNGTVWIKSSTDPTDNLLNVAISASNVANTNASTKVVRDSTGVLTTVAANTIAQDHDGTRYGIRVEPAATNLLLQSQDISTTWTNGSSSESVNSTTAPDGTATADTLIEDLDVAQTHSINQTSASVTSGTTYTFSCYAKKKERTFLRLAGATTRFPDNFHCDFDLNAGTVGTAGAGATVTGIEALASNWYRCWIVSTCDSTGTNVFTISIGEADTDITYDGDGTSGLFLWGAQLEAGSGPTSYMATTAATVTRAADKISCATSTYPHSNSAGTFVVWFRVLANYLDTGGTLRLVTLADGTANEVHLLYVNPVAGATVDEIRILTKDGGAFVANLTAGNIVSPTLGNKAAYAYALNNIGLVADGGAAVTDITCTMPTVTNFDLGCGSTAAGQEFNGLIYQMIYFPRRLSTAEMQTRTA